MGSPSGTLTSKTKKVHTLMGSCHPITKIAHFHLGIEPKKVSNDQKHQNSMFSLLPHKFGPFRPRSPQKCHKTSPWAPGPKTRQGHTDQKPSRVIDPKFHAKLVTRHRPFQLAPQESKMPLLGLRSTWHYIRAFPQMMNECDEE